MSCFQSVDTSVAHSHTHRT